MGWAKGILAFNLVFDLVFGLDFRIADVEGLVLALPLHTVFVYKDEVEREKAIATTFLTIEDDHLFDEARFGKREVDVSVFVVDELGRSLALSMLRRKRDVRQFGQIAVTDAISGIGFSNSPVAEGMKTKQYRKKGKPNRVRASLE